MIDLFERSDPAMGIETNMVRLRSLVDERTGLTTSLRPPAERRHRRPWVVAAAAFVAVIAVVAVPSLLRSEPGWVFETQFAAAIEAPGIGAVVPLASGGIQGHAVDGDTIWVMTSLQGKLQRISAASGEVDASFSIDGYVEGVVAGSDFVWLMSYDNGGEVLRFDPATGAVDMAILIGGLPGPARWFAGSLWVSNDQGQLLEISADGDVVSTSPGQLKGEGLGFLWVNDPATGLISSLGVDGRRRETVVPTVTGAVTADGWGVRGVTEAGGRLWLMDDDYPFGTNFSIFDPATGELKSLGVTWGLNGMTEFDGSLWVTSSTDHLLIRIDPATGEQHRYPLPGRPGGVLVADGSLWVTLLQPGVLVRIDPDRLIESGEVVADDWNLYPHRLLCTGNGKAQGPTVILEPFDWIEYGSWSVIQAQLSQHGFVVCANGYLRDESTPAQRAADLEDALVAGEIPGPYVLVSIGDGVHTTRLFADGRDDIAGVVLVDPMPIGFQTFYDAALSEIGETPGHPPWLDLDPATSSSLDDFGDRPLVVIGQDPEAVFRNSRFVTFAGAERAAAINSYWQDGLSFYASQSTDSRLLEATGTGMDGVLWSRPELVLGEILDVLARITP